MTCLLFGVLNKFIIIIIIIIIIIFIKDYFFQLKISVFQISFAVQKLKDLVCLNKRKIILGTFAKIRLLC